MITTADILWHTAPDAVNHDGPCLSWGRGMKLL